MGHEEMVGKADRELSLENLIRVALETKLSAIGGYDAIIWKIRAGYVAILYGALTLLLGVGGPSGLAVITGNLVHAVSILILILGLSVTAFIVDFSYVRKKLKVIVARDELIDIALQSGAIGAESIRILLHIAGETFVESFPDKVQKEYRAKRNWNLKWVLVPLYTTTPLLAMFICLISFAQWFFSLASLAS
jgi:hypothetical protein